MIVVDASVMSYALITRDAAAHRLRVQLQAEDVAVPALLDSEVLSSWRRRVRIGQLQEWEGHLAVLALGQLPLKRVACTPRMLERIWELRDNVTAYDATYVALAEQFDATLWTADGRLARAPGLRCAVRVIP